MVKIDILDKEFSTCKEGLDFIKKHKTEILNLKKRVIKHTDGFSWDANSLKKKIQKSEGISSEGLLQVDYMSSVSNFLDSHQDVHLQGIFDKSIANGMGKLHLDSHTKDFSHFVSDDVTLTTKQIQAKELGYDSNVLVEAVSVKSIIDPMTNAKIHKFYANGIIKYHSVGMSYTDFDIITKEEDNEVEMTKWNKYIKEVINPEKAHDYGYFFVIKEANLHENSSVIHPSNRLTITTNVQSVQDVAKRFINPNIL